MKDKVLIDKWSGHLYINTYTQQDNTQTYLKLTVRSDYVILISKQMQSLI